MNRNQLYSRVITELISNKIIVHSMTGDLLYYGDTRLGNNYTLDIFIHRDYHSLYTFDSKHITIHKYVK